jgi:hypothetical protein
MISDASSALRVRAAEIGASAVTGVEYFHQSPRFWTLKPERVLTARGVAVSLGNEPFLAGMSDSEEMAGLSSMPDPKQTLSSHMLGSGMSCIVWAIINAVAVYYQASSLRPGESLVLPPTVIYIVSVILFVVGILLIRIRKPKMLIFHGITLIIVGIVNIAGLLLWFLGGLQIVWGIKAIYSSAKVTNAIQEYARKRAELQTERSRSANAT